MRIKRAFTLAEVLITMGILGVIAAVSMPALMSNVDKNTWSNGLKVNVSNLNNAFKEMMSNEDTDDLRDTTLWSNNVPVAGITSKNDAITTELRKYFRIEKVENNWPKGAHTLSGSAFDEASVRYYLANSSTLNIKFMNDNRFTDCAATQMFCHPVAEIIVDVNGDKRPNVMGKDMFSLFLAEDGAIFPNGSEAVYNYDNSKVKWDTANGCQGKQPKGDGKACTGRVFEEDFKINYN